MNFLQVQFYLGTETYQPQRKGNNNPVYIQVNWN